MRIAKSDSQYDKSEVETIKKVLMEQLKCLKKRLIPQSIVQSNLSKKARYSSFYRALKNNIPYENRRQIIQGLWQVALADGSRDSEEDAVIRLAAKLLGVTDVESAVARKSAQGKS